LGGAFCRTAANAAVTPCRHLIAGRRSSGNGRMMLMMVLRMVFVIPIMSTSAKFGQ